MCPAVDVGPERTLWTGFAFGIVDAFLVRTAVDLACRDDSPGAVAGDKHLDLGGDGSVEADVRSIGEPTLEDVGLSTLRRDDADGHFGGAAIVGAVERNGGDRLATESPASRLANRRAGTLLDLHGLELTPG